MARYVVMTDQALTAAVREHADVLYCAADSARLVAGINGLSDAVWSEKVPSRIDQTDVWLIAYADHVSAKDRTPLQVMATLLAEELAAATNGIHVLPFHPWTSDDGFAISDFTEVDPRLGTWSDLGDIGQSRRLMVDGVVNHISASHPWVKEWLAGERDGWIMEPGPDFDTTHVVRPRTTPLLTPFEGFAGRPLYAWTTFGPDQVDLDYSNPDVLVAMTKVLLTYVRHGAAVIRLDAVGFLWKESGTSCIHLPKTHEIVRLWRTVLAHLAPGTMLITETNVPHEENVSYFGSGSDEAHLVYQFPLAPMVLAAYVWGNAQDLSRWAASIGDLPPGCWFLNLLASHDGIGLRPVEGLLSRTQVAGLCDLARWTGGGVSYRANEDGSQEPYELNTTYTDALRAVAEDGLGVARLIGAHAVLLALQGIPGIWFGSMFGQPGNPALVKSTGQLRSINRSRIALEDLRQTLGDARTAESATFEGISRLAALRRSNRAFAPESPQEILPTPGWYVGIVRGNPGRRAAVVVSVSDRDRQFDPCASLGGQRWRDAMAPPDSPDIGPGDVVVLPPYGLVWLEEDAAR